MNQAGLSTQFGNLIVFEAQGELIRITWGVSGVQDRSAVLRSALEQLKAFDDRALKQFDLPLRVHGTQFQQDVCAAISQISFGDTDTYGSIAKQLGAPAQAVGQACGANPLPIIIPCHRVLGAKGMTGFSGAGGVETKVALLRHEGSCLI